MKIALFLGAGASVPYGKPTTKTFKELIWKKYETDYQHEYLRDFLRNENFDDIEHVLQSIKEIRNFLTGHGGLFFAGNTTPLQIRRNGSWHNFDMAFFKSQMEYTENTIQEEIFNHYRWNDNSNNALLAIFDKLFTLFEPKDGIHIFTTNYDNAVETYCGLTQKHKPIDGFKLNARRRLWIWENDFSPPDSEVGIDIFLHKLHGSLDWKELASGEIIKTHEESQPTDPRYEGNSLIYPTLSPKEEEELQPYDTIIGRFSDYMNTADACIVIGYSFRDSLNYPFFEMLEKGKTKLIIVSPTAISDLYTYYLKEKIPEALQNSISSTELYSMNQASIAGKISKIYCIQKYLTVKTIDEIMKDIRRCLNEAN